MTWFGCNMNQSFTDDRVLSAFWWMNICQNHINYKIGQGFVFLYTESFGRVVVYGKIHLKNNNIVEILYTFHGNYTKW